jgi:hypothetical protein
MPLPKTVDELKALKDIIKAMAKLIASKRSKTGQVKVKKDNVSKFDEYAADASSVLGPSIGKSILSLKKSATAKKPKAETVEAKAGKVLASFEKLAAKVDAAMVKVKEAEKKKAETSQWRETIEPASKKARSDDEIKTTKTTDVKTAALSSPMF